MRCMPSARRLLASVGLAFDWADTQEANQSQGGLFDFGDSHAASTHEPALVAAEPLDIRERLSFEKTALGFYFSGHLFDAVRDEVRSIAKRRIADLVDTREPQLLAGVVSDLRMVNGQRGRVAIFKLDDMSERIEAVVNDELLETTRDLLREDELLVVQGRAQPDRFTGGLRLNVQQVWDLAGARARFGRYLAVSVNGSRAAAAGPAAPVAGAPRAERAGQHRRSGLPVRLRIERSEARAELDLGDEGALLAQRRCAGALAQAVAHRRRRRDRVRMSNAAACSLPTRPTVHEWTVREPLVIDRKRATRCRRGCRDSR